MEGKRKQHSSVDSYRERRQKKSNTCIHYTNIKQNGTI